MEDIKVVDFIESLVNYRSLKKGGKYRVTECAADSTVFRIDGKREPLYADQIKKTLPPVLVSLSTPHSAQHNRERATREPEPPTTYAGIPLIVEDTLPIDRAPPAQHCTVCWLTACHGCSIEDTSDQPIPDESLITHPTGALRESKEGRGCQHLLRVGFPYVLDLVAKHMECVLGKERNWEKGLPLSESADAVDRHFTGHLSGQGDIWKDYVSALWNLLQYGETLHRTEVGTLPKELDDIDRGKRSEI